jgi:hypothetical protein
MGFFDRDIVARTCRRFCSWIEAVFAADGDFIKEMNSQCIPLLNFFYFNKIWLFSAMLCPFLWNVWKFRKYRCHPVLLELPDTFYLDESGSGFDRNRIQSVLRGRIRIWSKSVRIRNTGINTVTEPGRAHVANMMVEEEKPAHYFVQPARLLMVSLATWLRQ